MNIKQKRVAGEILGRAGISERIITIAKDISQGSYKNAIEQAGRIAELVDAATYDTYWNEKASIGRHKERFILDNIIEGRTARETAMLRIEHG